VTTDCELLRINGCIAYDAAVNRDAVELVEANAEELRIELTKRAGILDCKQHRKFATGVDCTNGRCYARY
jgi:hypothetical protein